MWDYLIGAGVLILLAVIIKMLVPSERRKPRKPTSTDPLKFSEYTLKTGIFHEEDSIKTGVLTGDDEVLGTKIVTEEDIQNAAALIVLNPEDFGKTFLIRPGMGRIGMRSQDNDVVLGYPGISRQHATIEITEGKWHLTDNNSTNGTFVNRRRITTPVPLDDKSLIGMGKMTFMFRIILSAEGDT